MFLGFPPGPDENPRNPMGNLGKCESVYQKTNQLIKTILNLDRFQGGEIQTEMSFLSFPPYTYTLWDHKL